MKLKGTFAAIAALATRVSATNSSNYATFVYNTVVPDFDQSQNAQFIWSINAVQSSGDIYFHFEAPYTGSWMAVGFGKKMPGSLMIVAYPSGNNTGMTVSPRIATDWAEPSYTTDREVDLIWDSSVGTPNSIQSDGRMTLDGVCRNCTTWNGGTLDLKSSSAPFIFAVGPIGDLHDDSPQAPLQRHALYGGFTMDMTAATSPNNGSVPRPNNGTYTSLHVNSAGGASDDDDWRTRAHAGIMIFSFLILFPLGALLLRLLNSVILHAVVQAIGFVFVIIALALGISISKYYNRSKSFNSAHQIIGLLLFAGLLGQLGLGIVGHRIFKRTNQPAKFMKAHVVLGLVLIFAAAVNGGLGLSLAQNSYLWTRYLVFCLAILIILIALRILAQRCVRRHRMRQSQGIAGQGAAHDGFRFPQFGAPKEPDGQSVPLRPYGHSNDSELQYIGQEHQPRQMV